MNEKVVHSSNSIIGIGSGKQNNNKIVINGLIDAYILITNKAIDTWQMFHSFHFLVFPFGTGVNNKLRIHHIPIIFTSKPPMTISEVFSWNIFLRRGQIKYFPYKKQAENMTKI